MGPSHLNLSSDSSLQHLFIFEPKDVGPIGSGSPAALRRSWVRSLEGANFCLWLKKNHRLPHVQSTVESSLTHKATGLVYGWGRGSGFFLTYCEKVILPLKQYRGDGLTPTGQVFIFEPMARYGRFA